MELGYRVYKVGDISKFDLDFVQVSMWHKKPRDLKRVIRVTAELREKKVPFVVHLLGLYMSDTRPQREETIRLLQEYAGLSDLGLIVHDETAPGHQRLHGAWRENYEDGLKELEGICKVSIENSHDSWNALWFWDEFADSITLDIGHFASSGMDVLGVIKSLTDEHLKKLEYIHVHKNNGRKPGGITDHWPLEEGCIELQALKELLRLKNDVRVVVEVDGEEGIRKSIQVISRWQEK